MKLSDLMRALEDQGEVNYGLTDHQIDKDETGTIKIKPLVPVVFLLDPQKQKRKKTKVWRFVQISSPLSSAPFVQIQLFWLVSIKQVFIMLYVIYINIH